MIGSAAGQNKVRKMHLVLHGNHLPMWIYDRETLRFLEVSEGAVELYGYTREELLRMTVRELGPVEEQARLEYLDPQSINGSHAWAHRRKDGTLLRVAIQSNTLIYEGRLAQLIVITDLSARFAKPEELKQSTPQSRPLPSSPSTKSSLTPQAPRSITTTDHMQLEQKTKEALDNADRTGRRVAVVCLDLDNIEEIVNRLGAVGGDECLKQVEFCLTRRVRGMDGVARTGPNTFTVVLAELDDDFDLYRVSEALLKIFVEPVWVHGKPFTVSASIGIAVYPDDGFDLTKLAHAADTAMHQARASGGHRIAIFSHEVRERTELNAYMRETMKRGGFRLHYQPQYSPAGEIRTLEVLLRLPGRNKGFISPDLFIPIAEETGMIEQLGMWVIDEASRQVRAWQREYGRLAHVAVNVSPLQLRGLNFAENALSAIRSHGVVPTSIEFEITERAVLNFDEVAEPMRKLAEAGIVFAVDDFGTGYSSLQHLHRLPISVLKIDRSFVQRMGVPQGAEAIIEAIVSMAHSLGMQVVAEGVETHAQRNAATRMGCDAIQGFLHSAAMEAAKVPGLMGWLN